MIPKNDSCVTQLLADESYWNKISHFMQSPSWLKQYSQHPEYKIFCSYDGNRIIAYSLARIRKIPILGNLMRIEWGPVAINLNALHRHINELKEQKGFVQIEISPYLNSIDLKVMEPFLRSINFFKRKFRRANYSHTLQLDLNLDLAEIKINFRRSLKTQINKAKRTGIEIRTNDKLSKMIAFYNIFAEKKHLEKISIEQYDFINDRLEKFNDILLSAYYKNKLIGVIFLIDNGENIIYQWGASEVDTEFSKLPIAHLLHWEGITLSKEKNFCYYDFGGYWNEKGNSNSINRFKTGFCKNIIAVSNEYIYSTSWLKNHIVDMIIKRRL